MIVAFRFLAALSVVPLTLAPIIAADLFALEERGAAMSLAMVFPLLAPPGAPIIGGFVSEALGWRWTCWVIIIPSGLVAVLLCLAFRETHHPTIRRRQVEVAETGEVQSEPRKELPMSQAFLRPLYLLIFAPAVSIAAVYMAVVYGMVYLVLTTLTEMLEGTYDFGQSVVGLGFLGLGTYLLPTIYSIKLTVLTSDRNDHCNGGVRFRVRSISPVSFQIPRHDSTGRQTPFRALRRSPAANWLPTLWVDCAVSHSLDASYLRDGNPRLWYDDGPDTNRELSHRRI